MPKSAAEERRELNAAVAVVQQQVAAYAQSLDELRRGRDAQAALISDLRVENATLRAELSAQRKDFDDFKRRTEVWAQRTWAVALALFTAALGAFVYYLRRQP